ncbi:MAG: YabP/YqfC family sporulation protein [Clostridia bacterium]|nr:YabP/YqfC family sporulation protein [Clostridia bacterium]
MIKLKRRIVESMDFPAEAALGLVRAQVLGREKMFVENHQGVHAYHADCIRLKTAEGILRVEGKNMELCELRRDRLYITGQISGFFYEMPQ